ncbi:hypothetical protein ACFQU7_18630 [Pseudoroseomonas wenyumeiae]
MAVHGAFAIADHLHGAAAQNIAAIIGVFDGEVLARAENGQRLLGHGGASGAGGEDGGQNNLAEHFSYYP